MAGKHFTCYYFPDEVELKTAENDMSNYFLIFNLYCRLKLFSWGN